MFIKQIGEGSVGRSVCTWFVFLHLFGGGGIQGGAALEWRLRLRKRGDCRNVKAGVNILIVHLVKELGHCREVAFSRGLGCFSVGLQLVFKICILYFTISNYLDLTRGTAGRRALVKVRISNHKLLLEIGRYNRTTRDNTGIALFVDPI